MSVDAEPLPKPEPVLHGLDAFDQWHRLHRLVAVHDDKEERLDGRSEGQSRRVDRHAKHSLGVPTDVLTVLWLGRNDEGSPLHALSSHDDVIRTILGLLEDWYKNSLRCDGGVYVSSIGRVALEPELSDQTGWRKAASFPKPSGLYCNMMPIVLPSFRGECDDWMHSVPREFHGYLGLIRACPLTLTDEGKIGYLTVDERPVTVEGASQRRGGLHAESPGLLRTPPGGGGRWAEPPHPNAITFYWGGGHWTNDETSGRGVYEGGVYMASTVAGSTRVWNAQVSEPGAMGPLGDIEHLRPLLGTGTTLDAGELVWMTDTTPHESLPLAAGTQRQYFRLVTSHVTAWYAAHSTPNPLGVKPPEHVRILVASKFAPTAVAAGQRVAPQAKEPDTARDSEEGELARAPLCASRGLRDRENRDEVHTHDSKPAKEEPPSLSLLAIDEGL